MSDPNINESPATPLAVGLQRLVGRRWKAVINGKKSINGERYSATYTGDVLEADDDGDIYDFLLSMADHLATVNAEMEYPDSIQVTLAPPPNNEVSHRDPKTGSVPDVTD